jgi:hypothetical protein
VFSIIFLGLIVAMVLVGVLFLVSFFSTEVRMASEAFQRGSTSSTTLGLSSIMCMLAVAFSVFLVGAAVVNKFFSKGEAPPFSGEVHLP